MCLSLSLTSCEQVEISSIILAIPLPTLKVLEVLYETFISLTQNETFVVL